MNTSERKTVDELIDLAKNDPEALEAYRQQQIEAVINEAPEYMRQRLRGLQFTIDGRRQLHKNPIGSCVEISKMMYESFGELQSLLNQITGQSAAQLSVLDKQDNDRQTTEAKVLPFPGKF